MGEVKRVIACTPQNVAQMREVVRQWPALHGLVEGLQAQGVFPGLRALQITLTGNEATVARGLDALTGEDGMLSALRTSEGKGEATCS